MTAVGDVIAAHRRLAFDSNLFIYLFEARGAEARAVALILDEAESAGVSMVVSSLTLAEVSVGPATVQDDVMADRYADAIRSIRGLEVVP
jgi:predicted nucleic acid-binding protein